MSIRAVFRVQCDGPGREWLSLIPDYRPGTDILPHHVVAAPTAERACNWPGERAARIAAQRAGWTFRRTDKPGGFKAWCPACAANPLGIVLPPSTPEQVAAVECGVMPSGPGAVNDVNPPCVCTHSLIDHEGIHLICRAIPGVTGCGCLGYSSGKETRP